MYDRNLEIELIKHLPSYFVSVALKGTCVL